MAPLRVDPAVRFWSRVQKGEGCWVFTGPISKSGYGVATVNRAAVRAHRYAWELQHGPIPSDLFVCHICDNRACVRGDHLYLGTHEDNMRDMAAKGRAACGERDGLAKLTRAQVAEIRRTYTGKRGEQRVMARVYNVTPALICAVLKGRIWKGI